MIGAAALAAYTFTWIPMTYNLSVPDYDEKHTFQHKFNTVMLNLADSNDTVVLHINSRGGFLYLALPVVNAILTSDALVISRNEGVALSAGALTAMAADKIESVPLSTYLFHRAYYIEDDKKHLLPVNSVYGKPMREFFIQYILKYLTNKELVSYLKGDDVIISGKELKKRMKKLVDSVN